MESGQGEGFFIFEKKIVRCNIYLYRNKYGEVNTNQYYVTNEFVFSQEDYDKLKRKYFTKPI